MKPNERIILLMGFVALAQACNADKGVVGPGGVTRIAADAVERPLYSDWSAPVNLGPVVNSGSNEQHPAISTLYFTVQNNPPSSDQGFDIYASTRTGDEGAFGPPVLVSELSTPFRDTRTAIRRDGLEIFLSSGRPGDDIVGRSAGSEDLWVSTRATASDAWSPPLNLNLVNQQLGGPPVNSAAFDGAPALSFDGTTLYFFSERTDLGGVGKRDLYVTTRTQLRGPDVAEHAGVQKHHTGEAHE